jgi:DNA-binding transcriptional MocR family regulator
MRYASMIKAINYQMKPQDIVILLKIVAMGDESWQQKPLAEELGISQSEVSQSVARSQYAGLLFGNGKQVMKSALLEFLQFGLAYVFPQKPGAVVRGIATAHAASPLKESIDSNESYVWPYAKGNQRGQAIVPLYPSVPEAALKDPKLYEMLALTDALRAGKAREKVMAIEELKKRIG